MNNKILIAVDLSDQTAGIIHQGFEFAKNTNGTILICSIIPMYVDYLQSQMALIPSQWDEIYNTQKEHAFKELTKIKERNPQLSIEVFVEVGNPKFDIIEKAKLEHSNYLVVGTHGHTGLYHTVIGSTAEYIIRHATIPVLVVPMNREEH
jgi:nucleotide-binding universal stress UspA family protein